jgi:hypothetical protein
MACHQNQDIIVTTMAENVVTGLFHQVLLLQYLKCGAAVLRAMEAVAVCKVIQQTQADMLLNLLT